MPEQQPHHDSVSVSGRAAQLAVMQQLHSTTGSSSSCVKAFGFVLLCCCDCISECVCVYMFGAGRPLVQAQPYFHENLNAGADEQYGPAQLQDRAAAADAAAAAGEPAKPPPAAAAASDSAETSQDATAAATAAAAAAAREMGLVPSGPNAAAVAAVAAEAAASFLKGTAIERQAAAVALGPEGFRELLAKVCAV